MCSSKKILFVGIPDMALVCLQGLLNKGFNIVGVMGPKKNHDTYYMFKKYVQNLGLNFIEYGATMNYVRPNIKKGIDFYHEHKTILHKKDDNYSCMGYI